MTELNYEAFAGDTGLGEREAVTMRVEAFKTNESGEQLVCEFNRTVRSLKRDYAAGGGA
ncbi:hypothetical protein [Natrinema sp. 74]|uniref:hypothetical protein n=1 Tax=Natrinema sp. 74 TaxID=3384159 RepID=UPI0038D49A16